MNTKQARILRILLLPQLLACIVIFLLRAQFPTGHAPVAVLTLCVFPLLAYPVCRCIPSLHRRGRPLQRRMAVAFAVIGYAAGLSFCFAANGSQTERFVYLTYSLCGLLIAVSTHLLGLKASGHACGVTGPVVILTLRKSLWYLFGLAALVPIFLSSLALKRHTLRELVLGSACAVLIGAVLSLFLPSPVL